jgi:hypothetical protein
VSKVANTSFTQAASVGNRGITLVRRRPSPKVRSRRLVVRILL